MRYWEPIRLKKFLISKNNDYIIHTEIHSVKDYRSSLGFDERCIFIVVCFQTLNWDVKKSQYVWNKIRTDWASVKYLVCTEFSVLNDILIIYIWTQIHTDWSEIYADSLVHCARLFVLFLWFATCKLKSFVHSFHGIISVFPPFVQWGYTLTH